jgi:GNAT superfamily N-acetyltransferase
MSNHLSEATNIIYQVSPAVTSEELNALFALSWPDYYPSDFDPILERSLAYICAYQTNRLIGFVNMAWDGGIHAFILDTTVHPDWRRRGIGRQLVQEAARVARERGIVWLHVDFEPHLTEFYRQCGFRHTEAGLMRL